VGKIFSAPVQTGPGAQPASCTMGTGSFPGVKSGRGVTLTPQPILVPWSRKSRAIPLLPLWAVRPVQDFRACTGVQFTFTLTLTLDIPLSCVNSLPPPVLFLLVPEDSFYMSRNMWHERQNILKIPDEICSHNSIHIIIPVLRPQRNIWSYGGRSWHRGKSDTHFNI